MNRDDIIRMAQECQLIGMRPHLDGIYEEALQRFAALVAAEKDKEIERLQDMLYELLGELTALRAEKQMRGYIKQLKDSAATSEREKVAEENAELLLREALKTYGQHRNNCAVVLGGYQCTCGFNQQEQPR